MGGQTGAVRSDASASCCSNLGQRYAKGSAGLPRNLGEAARWSRKGCELSPESYCVNYANIEDSRGNRANKQWALERSCAASTRADACLSAGQMVRGSNLALARSYWQKGCSSTYSASESIRATLVDRKRQCCSELERTKPSPVVDNRPPPVVDNRQGGRQPLAAQRTNPERDAELAYARQADREASGHPWMGIFKITGGIALIGGGAFILANADNGSLYPFGGMAIGGGLWMLIANKSFKRAGRARSRARSHRSRARQLSFAPALASDRVGVVLDVTF